jgi:hypothetical protein
MDIGDEAENAGDVERQPAAVDPDMYEEAVDPDVYEEVSQKRMLWAAEHGQPEEHFGSTLRGGAWTAAHSGQAVDSVRCFAKSMEAREFCQQHRLAKTATFSLRLYSDEVCALLGRVWTDRMSFLMERVASAPDAEQRLLPADLEGFRPLEALVADLRARGVGAISKRLDGILALKPGYLSA